MYKLDLNYVPAEQIINEVKNTLRTFFENGDVDESHLYPVIKGCITKMGLKIYPSKQTVLTVEDYKTRLPRDFYKVVSAIGCGKFTSHDIDWSTSTIIEKDVIEIPVCKTQWDYCHDDCGNLYEIVQQFPQSSTSYTDLFQLSFTKQDSQYCNDSCLYSYPSPNTVTIKNGYLNTAFESGSIYFEYITNMMEEDDFILPDQETILRWVKDEMIVEAFKSMYYNGVPDIERRLQKAEQSLSVSSINAQSVYKRGEMGDFYDLRKLLYNRYKKFKTSVYGKDYTYIDESVNKHNPYRGYK